MSTAPPKSERSVFMFSFLLWNKCFHVSPQFALKKCPSEHHKDVQGAKRISERRVTQAPDGARGKRKFDFLRAMPQGKREECASYNEPGNTLLKRDLPPVRVQKIPLL